MPSGILSFILIHRLWAVQIKDQLPLWVLLHSAFFTAFVKYVLLDIDEQVDPSTSCTFSGSNLLNVHTCDRKSN
jgi:hypothetical protein